jgi:hypothetical protein
MPTPFSNKASHALFARSSARTNGPQGGGPKKAGQVPTATLPVAKWLGCSTAACLYRTFAWRLRSILAFSPASLLVVNLRTTTVSLILSILLKR